MPLTGFHLQRENELEKSLWGRCMVERAAAYAYYQPGGKMQTLIHRLKYNGISSIGTYLGKLYGTILQEDGFLDDIDIIMPVPLHPVKERKRGFNQAKVICDGISESTGIDVDSNLLRRKVKTASQTRKSRVERWENVENIFEPVTRDVPPGTHILIVDDVITTGSTIEACVNTIREAFDVKVSVVSMAAAVSRLT